MRGRAGTLVTVTQPTEPGPSEQMLWRKAVNVYLAYRRLGLRRFILSGCIMPRSISTDVDAGDDPQDGQISAIANKAVFRGLVREKRLDCFRELGGGAGIAAALASNALTGIRGDDGDVRLRREVFGANTYARRRRKGFWSHVRGALSDACLAVLLVCAVVSLGLGIKERGGWYDGACILAAVFLIAAVPAAVSCASMRDQAQRFSVLAKERDDMTVWVVRGSQRMQVKRFDVVVGDVVELKNADVVPADGVLLLGQELQVYESSMTDAPHRVEVDGERNPFVASGVKVVDGYGWMVVTAVGTDTAWGKWLCSLVTQQEDTVPTLMQKRRDAYSSRMGKVRNVFAVLTALYFTGASGNGQGRPVFDRHHVTFTSVWSAFVGILKPVISIIVIVMPEGLTLAVTLTLAFFVRRMAKEHALVRRLSACETMGSVTTICASKTGMLAPDTMEVAEFLVGTHRPSSVAAVHGDVIRLLCQGAWINTTASVYKPDNVSPPEISGPASSTEKAVLSWAVTELGMDADALKRSCKVVAVVGSHKERRSILIRDSATGAAIVHCKGAAEVVLASCSAYVGADGGAARDLGAEQRRNLDKIISGMMDSGLRCIALAYKTVDGDGTEHSSEIDDQGLTLLGIVGLKKPCLPEVKAAIAACTKAGVAVKLVTEDNAVAARAIAEECGIISVDDDRDSGLVIEGHQFRAMWPEEQLQIVHRIRVMARSLPVDKLLLVERLKQKGDVVAFTGDGIDDDAPALKEANVGLSMGGVGGAKVAEESSDIVILNHSFETVVVAIHRGQCVYTNIQKFIQFQLTVNTVGLVVNFVSAVTSGSMALTTLELLWVNLVVDTMGALALATDDRRPTSSAALIMRCPHPHAAGRSAQPPLISNAMWRNLTAQAAFQVAALLALQYRGCNTFGTSGRVNRAMIFNVFVLCQLFNAFNAREVERQNVFAGVLHNRVFVAITAGTLAVQVMVVELLTRFTGTVRLTWPQWGSCFTIAAMSLPIGWAVKLVPVPAGGLGHILGLAKTKLF